jgi:hypothetical protein
MVRLFRWKLTKVNAVIPAAFMKLRRGAPMRKMIDRSGKAGYIIAWLLGVPIPILLIVFLLRGCN